MILKFPDLATLRPALITADAIPPAVAQAPAVVGFDDDGQAWVEFGASLSRGNSAELKKIGVANVKSSGASVKTEVTCWPEMLPLEPDRAPIDRLEQTPVLF